MFTGIVEELGTVKKTKKEQIQQYLRYGQRKFWMI